MLNGIIFVKESIISLDLQKILSRYYRIVNVFKNIEGAPINSSPTDFIIIDTDPYSEQELRLILDKLDINKNAKIISISSNSADLKVPRFIHREVSKPVDYKNLLEAIEQFTYSAAVAG